MTTIVPSDFLRQRFALWWQSASHDIQNSNTVAKFPFGEQDAYMSIDITIFYQTFHITVEYADAANVKEIFRQLNEMKTAILEQLKPSATEYVHFEWRDADLGDQRLETVPGWVHCSMGTHSPLIKTTSVTDIVWTRLRTMQLVRGSCIDVTIVYIEPDGSRRRDSFAKRVFMDEFRDVDSASLQDVVNHVYAETDTIEAGYYVGDVYYVTDIDEDEFEEQYDEDSAISYETLTLPLWQHVFPAFMHIVIEVGLEDGLK